MKKIIYIIIILWPFGLVYGQQTTTINKPAKESDGTFVLRDSIQNKDMAFNYHLKIEGSGKVLLQVKNAGSATALEKEFTINSLSEAAFYAEFVNLFGALPGLKKTPIREEAIKIFSKAEGKIEILDDEPNTANIRLLVATLPVILKMKDKTEKVIMLPVEEVSIEFEDGTIKNFLLKVKGNRGKSWDPKDDGVLQFRNNYPIGISGKFSPERLQENTLFAYNPSRVGRLFKDQLADTITLNGQDQHQPVSGPVISAYFKLDELIDYRPILESGKEDYSPANQVIYLSQSTSEITVKKEKRSKIFEVRSYTDIIGMGGDEPNGLIQIEARKKIFLLEDKGYLFNDYTYWGGLTYLEPVVRFSKIDKNNINLIPDTIGSKANLNATKNKILNVNTIDLYQYQTHSVDLVLNLLNFSFPQAKFNILIDAKTGIYRTLITDSLVIKGDKLEKTAIATTNGVNIIPYGINVLLKFLPDSRYQFTLTYSLFSNELLNSRYKQNDGRAISSYLLDGRFKISEDSSLFIRGGFIHQNNNAKLNFAQAQLGITLDIFKSNGKQ